MNPPNEQHAFLHERLATWEAYHNHKEGMAYAATALWVGAAAAGLALRLKTSPRHSRARAGHAGCGTRAAHDVRMASGEKAYNGAPESGSGVSHAHETIGADRRDASVREVLATP